MSKTEQKILKALETSKTAIFKGVQAANAASKLKVKGLISDYKIVDRQLPSTFYEYTTTVYK